jgi:hypothetical protein
MTSAFFWFFSLSGTYTSKCMHMTYQYLVIPYDQHMIRHKSQVWSLQSAVNEPPEQVYYLYYSGPERSIHCSTRIFPRVIQLKYTFRPALRSSCVYILVQTTRRNRANVENHTLSCMTFRASLIQFMSVF